MKQPSFGLPGTRACRCAAHATPGMVDVVSKKCGVDGCAKRPNFGPRSGERPSRCVLHAEPGMVDLVHKRCEAAGCGKQPTYGTPGGRRQFCAAHVGPGGVNLKMKGANALKDAAT